ncbi:MAG: 50S ribosomal protein L24 [Candidatus Harrisonbacteria bacterium]|nr:50S ribosomal protein L24 [Candidatus Harrisonbacteria bacterium]
MAIKKGDTVQIISGKDKGKNGKVMKLDSAAGTILIEGLNLFKKHTRPKKQGEKGQIISLPRPLNISKVMLFCSSCKKPSRVGVRKEGEAKARYCKRCKATL